MDSWGVRNNHMGNKPETAWASSVRCATLRERSYSAGSLEADPILSHAFAKRESHTWQSLGYPSERWECAWRSGLAHSSGSVARLAGALNEGKAKLVQKARIDTTP